MVECFARGLGQTATACYRVPMKIEIWSDVVCPWCYIGKRRLERALAGLPAGKQAQVVWRSFELDPDAPRQRTAAPAEHLAGKYGVSVAEAQTMMARVSAVAKEEGLAYRLADARSGNTFDAHRLGHFAAARGAGDRAEEVLMDAYFCKGLPIGDRAALAALAPLMGLDEAEVRAMLESDDYADAVRADEARAQQLGISGVPFFVIDGKAQLSGAQPVEVFEEALRGAGAQ